MLAGARVRADGVRTVSMLVTTVGSTGQALVNVRAVATLWCICNIHERIYNYATVIVQGNVIWSFHRVIFATIPAVTSFASV